MEHNAARLFTSHETLFSLTDLGCSINPGICNHRVFPSKQATRSLPGDTLVVARIKEIHK